MLKSPRLISRGPIDLDPDEPAVAEVRLGDAEEAILAQLGKAPPQRLAQPGLDRFGSGHSLGM